MDNISKAILAGVSPVMRLAADTARRVKSLEQNTTRTAADAACDAMVKMCDSFLRGAPIAVAELPHIDQALRVLRAYGKRVEDAMPEVQS